MVRIHRDSAPAQADPLAEEGFYWSVALAIPFRVDSRRPRADRLYEDICCKFWGRDSATFHGRSAKSM